MIQVIAGIIRNQRGEILIARRKAGKHLAGYWEFPGGKIEPEESPEECLKREIKEELNINIEVLSYLADSKHEYDSKTILLKGYLADYLGGEIEMKDHDQCLWVVPINLANYKLAPADAPFLVLIPNS